METNPVIIGLNVHEHRLPDFRRGVFPVKRFQFLLEGFKKALGTSVVPTVAFFRLTRFP
jgi:hypothetical protein